MMYVRLSVVRVLAAVIVLVALLPAIASAQGQTTGSVAGVVKDTSGGVLPGVTVEASSPALIERSRVGVSNDQGQYQIVALSPGSYTVTFTLPGFHSVRREGIELTVGFTANVNVELEVGAVEESITVSGEAPLVDIRSTAKQTSFTREDMDVLPTTKMFSALAVLIPGVTVAGVVGGPPQDVGGSMGERNPSLAYHGSVGGDMPTMIEGIKTNNAGPTAGGGNSVWSANNGIVEEVVIDTSGFAADTGESGVRVNYIAKQGGNRFSGSVFGAYTNRHLQSDNLDAAQAAIGLSAFVTAKIWDFNPAFGGPLKKDKLWFFYSYRHWGTNDEPAGTFWEKNPYDFVYEQDRTRPAQGSAWTTAANLRVTWQVSPRSKIAFYADTLGGCNCNRGIGANVAPEAGNNRNTPINNMFVTSYTWTISSRLLFETAQAFRRDIWNQYTYALFKPDAKAAIDGIRVIDSGLGLTYRALGPTTMNLSFLEPGRASISYVTGRHNLKVGTQWNAMANIVDTNRIGSPTGNMYSYGFVNGVPSSVTISRNAIAHDRVKAAIAVYAQDQWTTKRLTLNMGGRFDYLNGFIPKQHVQQQVLSPARDYPEYDGLPIWKDFSPRIGGSYDLFGNGKTALKASAGRFVESLGTGISQGVNPTRGNAVNVTTRSWTDSNGDFVPQESELGPSSNLNFGGDNVGIRYADGLMTGWGKRAWNWEMAAGVQQELLQGLSVEVGYFRRTRGNYRVTENTAVSPADFDPYCVTAPVDKRLPGGGGYQVCGLYNVKPAQFGRTDSVITLDKNVGTLNEIFDGLDINFTARLPRGVRFSGGTSTGRISDNVCDVVKNPNVSLPTTNAYGAGALVPASSTFCDITPPFLTQVKFQGSYPLPWWGLQASATFQSIPGPQITAAWAAPAAAVTAGLGRAPSGNVRSITIPLVAPGTMYYERLNQVDMRVSKDLRLRSGMSAQPEFDIYNLLNGNTPLSYNNTFGASWQNPTALLPGRTAKLGVLFRF